MMESIIVDSDFRNYLISKFDGETETQKGKMVLLWLYNFLMAQPDFCYTLFPIF